MPHGMLWNTGYSANQALLSSLPGSNDVIIADRLIHHSMISGIQRSQAQLSRYRHLALDELEDKLAKNTHRNCFVVTESLFSMDGD